MVKYIYPVVWLGLVVFASLTPSDKLPDFQLFNHADKVVHFCVYCGLSALSVPAFLKGQNYKRSYVLTFLFSVLTGILMEYLQSCLPGGRSAEIADTIANGIGALTGIVFYELLIRNSKLEKTIFRIG
jgi:VanZ family protein